MNVFCRLQKADTVERECPQIFSVAKRWFPRSLRERLINVRRVWTRSLAPRDLRKYTEKQNKKKKNWSEMFRVLPPQIISIPKLSFVSHQNPYSISIFLFVQICTIIYYTQHTVYFAKKKYILLYIHITDDIINGLCLVEFYPSICSGCGVASLYLSISLYLPISIFIISVCIHLIVLSVHK